MSSSEGSDKSSCWLHDGLLARLELSSLRGGVDLSRPEDGIVGLSWLGSDLPGRLLGMAAGEETTVEQSFSRGSDLIVSYASKGPQPFQWQVYWRAAALDAAMAQVDLIVSLQTPTLESFPSFSTATTLPAEETWSLPASGLSLRRLDDSESVSELQSGLAGIVYRSQRAAWSYVEMTEPADNARTTLNCSAEQEVTLRREFGGEFLEKGVIRRMRIRGVFLSREGDLEVAGKLFENFCKESPPLTT